MYSTHGIYNNSSARVLQSILAEFGFRRSALRMLDYEILLALSKIKFADGFTPEVISEINTVLEPCGKTFEDVAWK